MAAGRIAAIGERVEVEGLGLAGVLVRSAEDPDEVLVAWRSLPPDVALVILTPAAACVVPAKPPGSLPLTAVLPV